MQRRYVETITLLTALLAAPAALPQTAFNGANGIKHVLLISIDGMHSLDFVNCTNGVSGVNSGKPYCPNLAALANTGVNYLNASTSKPSDSFPGLMALVSGGSPKSVGAFYDVSYDRSLNPPAVTTGNGVAGGPCTPGVTPPGTTTEFDEGIDINQSLLNGGAPGAGLTDGGVASIDATRLERDMSCNPVYPWNFVRTNTIFGVIHQAGGYTAWSDKHPSYSAVSGPGSGTNVNDYYSPEINSTVVNLPGVLTPTGMNCSTIPDPTQTGAWTDSFENIQCYDTLKVNAILNEIDGKTHLGKTPAPVPTLFGMNFQAVSVGEKLIEANVGSGGYTNAAGTPSTYLLNEIQFVDTAIGKMVSELSKQGLLESTWIVISAKHGQSPIDPNKYFPIPGPNGTNGMSPATILENLLPWSESPANPTGIGPTEDDISLIWLANESQTDSAVTTLESNLTTAGIGEIFNGPAITTMFNAPGLPPYGDPRTPDIIVTPNFGVVYTGSSSKQMEHGGFSHDDTNVMLLLSNPGAAKMTIQTPVQTLQIAPTILHILGLNPGSLQSVEIEGTTVLPGMM